jgi:hypothetical protein
VDSVQDPSLRGYAVAARSAAAAESLSTSREMIAAGFLNSKDPKTVEKGSILATMGQRGGSTFGHRSSAPV